MACSVHVGDSLTVTLTLTNCDGTALSVAGATTQEIILKGPSTRSVEVSTFVTDGTDGQITADFDAGVIDEEGTWRVQGHVILPGTPDLEYRSEIKTFPVEGNL